MIDCYQSGCCYLLSIHSQETIQHCNVYSHSSTFRWEAHVVLLRQQPYIQNRKRIPPYKINTLNGCILLLAVCCSSISSRCIERIVSECMEDNIFAVELVVKYFATAHLFIININSVFQEIVR